MSIFYIDRFYVLIALYVIINLIVICSTWHSYSQINSQYWVCLARSMASVVYLNSPLVLFSMMRVSLSRIKYYRIAQWLLLDKYLNIHQIAGHTVFLASCLHILAYVGQALTTGYNLTSNLTGCWLGGIFGLFWICTWSCIRHSRWFELFYYSHYLFIPIQLLLCFHAPKYLMYMTIPIIGYLLDRSYRFYVSFYPSQLLGSVVVTKDILEIQISRPKSFTYYPGDYMYICIPEVSKTQWHPFSLSSDPNDQSMLTIHMKKSGDWTHQVAHLCETTNVNLSQNRRLFQPLIYLDGPLSTPSSSMIKHPNLILVAQGVGITPFLSLLKYYCTTDPKNNNSTQITLFWITQDTSWCQSQLNIKSQNHIKIQILSNYPSNSDWNHYFQKINCSFQKINYSFPRVYVCGSSRLGQQIYPIAMKHNFEFKQESF